MPAPIAFASSAAAIAAAASAFRDAAGLRPTPDRVRETLFNWLGQDLTGAATLDLYAGTGVLTLEALSRGAALSVAVDRNPRADPRAAPHGASASASPASRRTSPTR